MTDASTDTGEPHRPNMTRRWALGVLGATSISVAGAWTWLRLRAPGPGRPPQTGNSDTTLETVAAFSGACFGHQLSAIEIAEVVRSLNGATVVDPPLAGTFPTLVAFVDGAARQHGAAHFIAASAEVRNQIVGDIMTLPVGTRRSAVLALVSPRERDRRQIRWGAMERLPRIYARSGPAWRRRGYARWPGISGDPREYTRPGQQVSC